MQKMLDGMNLFDDIFDEMQMFKTPKIRWIHCVGGGVYSIHFVKSVCSSSQQ